MGLKETVASAVAAGFTAVGNIKTSVTVRTVTKTYDEENGTTTEVATDTTVSGILTDYTQYEINNSGGGMQIHDRKLIVQVSDLTTAPTPDTTRVIISNTTYRIVPKTAGGRGIWTDPTRSVYIIHLRAA